MIRKAIRAILDAFLRRGAVTPPHQGEPGHGLPANPHNCQREGFHPPELCEMPEPIIPLHVDVYVVTDGVDYDAVYQARRAMDIVADFWREKLGIAVLAHVSGWVAQESINTSEFRDIHVYGTRGQTPSLYVFPGLPRVGLNHLGEAFTQDGYATIAGQMQSDQGQALIDSHELGHLVSGSTAHEEGTFISVRINPDSNSPDNNSVGRLQRILLRRGAMTLAGTSPVD